MNHKFYPRAKTILSIGSFVALFLSACQSGQPPAPTLGPVELAQTQAAEMVAGATAEAILGDAQATAEALTGETPAPTAGGPLPVGMLVPALLWTPWDLNNLVIPGATVVRPTRPFEGEIPMPVLSSTVYQLKTDLDDTNPAGTWKPGELVYEYDVPAGWQPQYRGTQGETSVSLCWQREEKDGDVNTEETQVLMKTMNGNGASALVSFVPNSAPPPLNQRCAASN